MPVAAKRPCPGGCGQLVAEGFCGACRGKGKARERKPEWHTFYDYRWQRASGLYLKQHPIAADIFDRHSGRLLRAVVVDHIIPHKGDRELFWDQENWQGLTKSDHDRKTALEQQGLWPPAGCINAGAAKAAWTVMVERGGWGSKSLANRDC
ncbi:MAG: HNH endonuclease [Acidobacteria bacterium]|nr:HNH endonuclease [Acidobacteriota bacterium]